MDASAAEMATCLTFAEAVQSLRDSYAKLRQHSNLNKRYAIQANTERVNGRDAEMFWFEDGTELGQFVRLVDIPGTLSGDILRLRRDLPSVPGHFEIDGDTIRPIEDPPAQPTWPEDFEDISAALAPLPLVQVDPSRHHVKRGKYRSEIENLLKCQGGACPGTRRSPRVVQLLGRSPDGQLVFEKLLTRGHVLYRYCSVAGYKRWILDLIEGFNFPSTRKFTVHGRRSAPDRW